MTVRIAWSNAAAILLLLVLPTLSAAFTQHTNTIIRPSFVTKVHSSTVPDLNAVEVAKTGGQGVISASQKAADQNLSLGAHRGCPRGGHYLTKGGIQVTANVELKPWKFSKSLSKSTSKAAIDFLIEQLDSHCGVLLTNSYEFPGCYARWSLGFVNPPLEVSGRANQCTIWALNNRGKVLLPAIQKAMEQLKDEGILETVNIFQESMPANGTPALLMKIVVTVVPLPEVGMFSGKAQLRQVRGKTESMT